MVFVILSDQKYIFKPDHPLYPEVEETLGEKRGGKEKKQTLRCGNTGKYSTNKKKYTLN